jgi:hypothetical protein
VYKLSTPTDISARVMVGPKKGCRTAWEPLDATHSARSASRSSPRGGGKCSTAVRRGFNNCGAASEMNMRVVVFDRYVLKET